MWIVSYSFTCCNTGSGFREYRFDTKAEADEFYNKWAEDVAKGGMGWSDGPENMWEPIHENELNRRKEEDRRYHED